LVAAAKFLVAATKILFVVPNFIAVTKPFFSMHEWSQPRSRPQKVIHFVKNSQSLSHTQQSSLRKTTFLLVECFFFVLHLWKAASRKKWFSYGNKIRDNIKFLLLKPKILLQQPNVLLTELNVLLL